MPLASIGDFVPQKGQLLAGTLLAALLCAPAAAQTVPRLPDLPVTAIEQAPATARPPAQPVTRLSTRAELDGLRTLSVTIARPTPVRSVLQLLVRGTPFSVVLPSNVRGTFSGELRNLSLRQALEAVLFAGRLDYELRGTVIRVFPRQPKTRIFSIDRLAVRRSWDVTGGAGVISSAQSDSIAEIDRGVRALLSTAGRHHVDGRAGIVHVTDFADRLDQVALYLEALQARAVRQVRIEIRVFRVRLAPNRYALAPIPAVVPDIPAFTRALESVGTVELIASPHLFAMNNEPAMLRVNSGGDPGAGAALSLIVTPQISADGFVQLSIAPRVPDPVDSEPASRPAILESDSVLRMRDGETVALSGLPVGAAAARTELVILLTPFIAGSSIATQAGLR